MKSLDNAQDLLLAHKAELQKMVDQLKETVEREKQLQSEAEKRAQATIQENENLLKDASSQLVSLPYFSRRYLTSVDLYTGSVDSWLAMPFWRDRMANK